MTTMHRRLVARIERFLAENDLRESTFGRLACNDGSFVADLRKGRNVSIRMTERVNRFMRGYRKQQPSRAA